MKHMASSPDLTPVPKVAAAGLGGAVAVLVVWLLGLAGVDVPAEAGSAIAALAAFAAGYITPPAGTDA